MSNNSSSNNSDEQEYRIPVKVLTNRDPIIAGKLSLREMGQWVVALVLLYIVLNLMPGPFQIKAILAAILIMGAVVFIHIPINGLAGIEWVFINFRYRAEKRLHSSTGSTMTPDSVLLAATRPTFAFTTAQTATNNNPFNSETEISGSIVVEVEEI